jgi:hypothetical protein
LVQSFPVLGEASAAAEPSDHPSDDPSLGWHDEFASVTSFDDFDIGLPTESFEGVPGLWALLAASSREHQQERAHSEQACNHPHGTIAISDIGGTDHGAHRKAKGRLAIPSTQYRFRMDAKNRDAPAGSLGTTRR